MSKFIEYNIRFFVSARISRNSKLVRVFVLQVLFISIITVLGVYAAANIVMYCNVMNITRKRKVGSPKIT